MSDPVAYRVEDAARALSVSRATVYRLIAAKQLESRKALGRRIIPKAAIEAFLKTGEAA